MTFLSLEFIYKAFGEFGSYEDSVALAHYSMYYHVMALFFRMDIKCENHTASIILLKKIFDINNKIIEKVKIERADK